MIHMLQNLPQKTSPAPAQVMWGVQHTSGLLNCKTVFTSDCAYSKHIFTLAGVSFLTGTLKPVCTQLTEIS